MFSSINRRLRDCNFRVFFKINTLISFGSFVGLLQNLETFLVEEDQKILWLQASLQQLSEDYQLDHVIIPLLERLRKFNGSTLIIFLSFYFKAFERFDLSQVFCLSAETKKIAYSRRCQKSILIKFVI